MNQSIESTSAAASRKISEWKKIVAEFEVPHAGRAIWQLVNSLGLYIGLWVAMYFLKSVSWWLVAPVGVLAAGVLVRVFIIFHDCGHGSFFKSKAANTFWGRVTGLMTFNCYDHWRWEHSIHHQTSGNLDKRGMGDIWTLTVEEYLESSRWRRFSYRLTRNPIVLFVIAPLALFLIMERFARKDAKMQVKVATWLTNVVVAMLVIGLSYIFGLGDYIIIQLSVLGLAASAGIWLFYVQHQFEDVYWERRDDWDFTDAALDGSSFYKLPKVLQWFAGNIGFHHIHHLSSKVPNYNLERCHYSHELLHSIEPLTIRKSLKSINFRLFDEENGKMVGFRAIRGLPRGEKRKAA